jgi:CRP-like cAMP-binding protein
VHDKKQTTLRSDNLLLNSLPREDYERLENELAPFELVKGDFLYRQDEPIRYIYFPESGMCSIIATTPDGQSAEVGVAGREGAAGIDVLLGVDATSNESMVQLPGRSRRIKTAAARSEFKRGGAFQAIMLRYLHGMMTQVSQTALCNRLHSVEQRLSRWLLMSHDRSSSDELPLTQEFLAIMLGVNRPTVSNTAVQLQGGGFIKYSRGRITMLDRDGLEDFTCDCYGVIKEHSRLD